MDLEGATNELYGLAPAHFIARRGELATQARKAGLADVAKGIRELRRPTVSAWLVNQLARDDAGHDELDRLSALGAELREAQAALDGPRMNQLTRRRQDLVATLVRRAEATAAAADAQQVGASVQRELEETFGAAVADERACLAVTSGRLTRALAYAGLGEVDITAATATPLNATPRPRRVRPPAREAPGREVGEEPGGESGAEERRRAAAEERRRAAAAEAAQAAEEARTALSSAEEVVTAGAGRRDTAQARAGELSSRLEELQAEIVRTRHELDAATREAAAADRDHRRQERQATEARKALQRAELELTRLASQA